MIQTSHSTAQHSRSRYQHTQHDQARACCQGNPSAPQSSTTPPSKVTLGVCLLHTTTAAAVGSLIPQSPPAVLSCTHPMQHKQASDVYTNRAAAHKTDQLCSSAQKAGWLVVMRYVAACHPWLHHFHNHGLSALAPCCLAACRLARLLEAQTHTHAHAQARYMRSPADGWDPCQCSGWSTAECLCNYTHTALIQTSPNICIQTQRHLLHSTQCAAGCQCCLLCHVLLAEQEQLLLLQQQAAAPFCRLLTSSGYCHAFALLLPGVHIVLPLCVSTPHCQVHPSSASDTAWHTAGYCTTQQPRHTARAFITSPLPTPLMHTYTC